MTDPRDESRPAERPLPAYGELAPEGWEWKPEAASAHADPSGQSGSGAPAGASASGNGSAGNSTPGVPHNLGVRGGSDGQTGARATAPGPSAQPAPEHRGDPEPYRAPAP